ncbi:MAG: UvrD-helicase domain-containing protein [Candidatus Edwardsbacteria bacterium]|nr:UvrD-helicase domain-containing protein [Candidatus Edwardsbacteria bacterium]
MARGLNRSQESAVTHGNGPLLIIAGAGTGKTRVITERIRYLIESKKAKPSEILALTFTEKASREMSDRVDAGLPIGHEEIWISTFHSFCERLLRQDGLEIGLDTSYRILTEPEVWLFVRQNLFKFQLDYYRPLSNPAQFIHALLRVISRAKDEDISAGRYLQWAEDNDKKAADLKSDDKATLEDAAKQLEVARAYLGYQKLMLDHGFMDFADLQTYCLKALREKPGLGMKYQKRFRYLLVDEYQDTNYSQNQMLKLLVGQEKNITVCGDDDQSIYKFRGASISNILQFRRDFPEARTVVLTDNYRSGQRILDAAYRLIQFNNPDRLEASERVDKKLQSLAGKADNDIRYLSFKSAEDEASWVSEEIWRHLQGGGRRPSDFAILSRNNDHLLPFVTALKQRGIPYQLVGNRGLYDLEEVKNLIAYIQVLHNFYDNAALFRLLTLECFELPMEDITRLLAHSRLINQPLYETMDAAANPSEKAKAEAAGSDDHHTEKKGFSALNAITPESIEKIKKIKDLIETHLELSRRQPASLVLLDFIRQTNYARIGGFPETPEEELRIKNIGLFLAKLNQFESLSGDRTVKAFAEWLKLMDEAGDDPAQAVIEDVDVVTLSTVHSAKGLEYPMVFMVQLAHLRFPGRNLSDQIELPDELVPEDKPAGDFHIQEERRLFYVGLTRAREQLYLTAAEMYTAKKLFKPSGFIAEALGETPPQMIPAGVGLLPAAAQTKALVWEQSPPPSPAEVTRFSYSQFKDYEKCPRFYKLKYILKIPETPAHNASFGKSIHDALNEYHQNLAAGKSINGEQLKEIYRKRWVPVGYKSQEHEQAMYQEGLELLEKYCQMDARRESVPEMLEKEFSVRLASCQLVGRIDRIDRLPDGDYEVIDYKTGKSRPQKEVDKDEQLTVYALACHQALGLKPKIYSLYFVKQGEKISTARSEKQMEEIKAAVNRTVEDIRAGNFKPVKNERSCGQCQYQIICG